LAHIKPRQDLDNLLHTAPPRRLPGPLKRQLALLSPVALLCRQLFFLSIVLAAVAFLLSIDIARGINDGDAAVGTVVEKRIDEGILTRYQIKVEFYDANGWPRGLDRYASIEPEAYEKLTVGLRIRVQYDKDNPDKFTVEDDVLGVKEKLGIRRFAVLPSIVIFLMGVGCYFLSFRGNRAKIDLIRNGIRTEASVTAVVKSNKAYNFFGKPPYYIIYRFLDHNRKPHVGKAQAFEKREVSQIDTGDFIDIVYVKESPQQSTATIF